MANAHTDMRFPRSLLGTCPIPWDSDHKWDERLFRRTVRALTRDISPDLYVFGTAGEGYAVSDRQFRAITQAFLEEMFGAHATPMVGIISLSLTTIVERIAWALERGTRHFQISLPAWARLDDTELARFFNETCGRFPEASFLHYNLARAGRVLTGADYRRLAGQHPNLVAIKMGGGDLDALEEVAGAVPQVRCFFTELAYIALRERHECGLLCALGGCAPALARRLHAASTAQERRELEPTFRALHAAAREAVAGCAHIDGAYDKMYLKLNYADFPLRLLPPYSSVDENRFARFQARCREALSHLST